MSNPKATASVAEGRVLVKLELPGGVEAMLDLYEALGVVNAIHAAVTQAAILIGEQASDVKPPALLAGLDTPHACVLDPALSRTIR